MEALSSPSSSSRSPRLGRRSLTAVYAVAARVWLVAGALALLLPSSVRLGLWLPLHLVLAGAVTVAISGFMQNFAGALTATPSPRTAAVAAQFALVNVGAALVAAGYPAGVAPLVATGGAAFLVGILLLVVFLWRAWRRGLNRRHPLPMALYGVAALSLLAGGTIGAVLGSGAVHDGLTWMALRATHMSLNVLGWVSLTIVGTLVTFLPTVLRVRMPTWRGAPVALALCGGLGLLAAGLALRSRPVATAGAVAYAVGASGVAWLAARVLRMPRRWPVSLPALHLLAALAWFLAGTLTLATLEARGLLPPDGFPPVLLVELVAGWILQTLLGALLYLVTVARPGDPGERRVIFTAIDVGGRVQVAAANAGLALLAIRAAGIGPGALAPAGAGLAIAGGAATLVRTWAGPALARIPAMARRAERMWRQ